MGGTTRTALVTGASYGVGAATALALAGEGFALAITATRVENLGATVAKLKAAGAPVMPLVLDLRSQSSIETVIANMVSAFSRIDLLVNNAGANLRKPALEVTAAEWEDLMGINLRGTFFLSREFARVQIARHQAAAIVNIASTHGLVGAAERSVYGISKGGLIQMTRMLAVEWAEHGIRVNAIAPGRLETQSPSRAARTSDPQYMQALRARAPLGRLATVEEVAGAVCFLASERAASITGQTLVLDGGLTAT